MKFSEAMLLGLPEIKFDREYWLYEYEGTCTGCLLGSALYAQGELEVHSGAVVGLLRRYWPKLSAMRIEVGCPIAGCAHLRFITPAWAAFPPIASWCTHMARHYQNGELTKEQIADWIHSFEPEEDEVEAPAPAWVRVPITRADWGY